LKPVETYEREIAAGILEAGSPLQDRIVFITGWLEDQELEGICLFSGNAFIRKPFSQADFLPPLERALGIGREAWMGPCETDGSESITPGKREA
jgi:hypothetical protein